MEATLPNLSNLHIEAKRTFKETTELDDQATLESKKPRTAGLVELQQHADATAYLLTFLPKQPDNVRETYNKLLGNGPAAKAIWEFIEDYGYETLYHYVNLLMNSHSRTQLDVAFPMGMPQSVDSITDLWPLQTLIACSMMFPNLMAISTEFKLLSKRYQRLGLDSVWSYTSENLWIFSCHPKWNDGKIRVERMLSIPETFSQTFQLVFEQLETAYAFKTKPARSRIEAPQSPDDKDEEDRNQQPIHCGSFNCVFPTVPIGPQSNLGRVIDKLQSIQSSTFGLRAVVRAPMKLEPEYLIEKANTLTSMIEQVTELLLTLQMAQLGITPPVYAAVPVFRRREDKRQFSQFGFVYVSEGDWIGLDNYLNTKSLAPSQMKALGTAIVHSLKWTSDNYVLLFDIKTGNIIVKPINNDLYEVRMIDFGSDFTVNANRLGSKASIDTSAECVFFVNGLLLLNMAYDYHNNRRMVFSELVLEMVATWQTMKELSLIDGFCAWLTKDMVYAQRIKRRSGQSIKFEGPNLSFVKEDEFFKALTNVFYTTLRTYGYRINEGNAVDLNEMKAPVWAITSYVERFMNELKNASGWLDNDEAERRLKRRIGEMKQERKNK